MLSIMRVKAIRKTTKTILQMLLFSGRYMLYMIVLLVVMQSCNVIFDPGCHSERRFKGRNKSKDFEPNYKPRTMKHKN